MSTEPVPDPAAVDRAETIFQRVNSALRRPDDWPAAWVGLGLEDVPGKPFGWAFNQERSAIRAHLARRLGRFGGDALAPARLEGRISRIQERLHRRQPTMRDRQAAWKKRTATPPRPSEGEAFTVEELARLADLFGAANDPVTASIGAKAAAQVARAMAEGQK